MSFGDINDNREKEGLEKVFMFDFGVKNLYTCSHTIIFPFII